MIAESKLVQFLKSDRQWPRALRLAHAKHQLGMAETEQDRRFWKEVLKRNAWSKEDESP